LWTATITMLSAIILSEKRLGRVRMPRAATISVTE
jgi:hypothetical protein